MDIEQKKDRRSSAFGMAGESNRPKDQSVDYLDASLSGSSNSFVYPSDKSTRRSEGRNKFSEADIIQAVEIFFDSILDPSQTSDPVRDLLGDLRGPVLLAVTANPEFLTDGRHPARRLIKAVFSKGHDFSLDPNYQRNPHFLAVSRIIKRLVSEYNNDERLFLRAFFDINQLA